MIAWPVPGIVAGRGLLIPRGVVGQVFVSLEGRPWPVVLSFKPRGGRSGGRCSSAEARVAKEQGVCSRGRGVVDGSPAAASSSDEEGERRRRVWGRRSGCLDAPDDLCPLGLELCGVALVGLLLAVFEAGALVVL